MSSIGERIRQERLRLGYNQADFAALVCVSRKTQIHWEDASGPTPTADVLASWAKSGADVLFIVTGTNGTLAPALNQDEALLIDQYRSVPEVVQVTVAGALRAAVQHAHPSTAIRRFALPKTPTGNA